MRKPDFIIGDPENPYLLRWYLIPQNDWFNIYLHKILRDDDDRALHDHPWHNVSIILKGSYEELTFLQSKHYIGFIEGTTYTAGSIRWRRAPMAHRLVVKKGPIWTLFLTGPRLRDWGFYCPQGWRSHSEYVDPTNPGLPGRGCD